MIEGANSVELLQRLRDTMATVEDGQERLDKTVKLIASSLGTDVCSIYFLRSDRNFELCATQGLSASAVHETVMRAGEGLVGRVADRGKAINTANAPETAGFSYRPETGEEIYHGFCGVPILYRDRVTGVLVVQTKDARKIATAEMIALEMIAIVLADMNELGLFKSSIEGGLTTPHQGPLMLRGVVAQEGVASGEVVLHDPNIVITNPVADDADTEKARLKDAFDTLDRNLSRLDTDELDKEAREILAVFEGFSRDKGFRRRLEEDIESGLSAEAAVELEQSRLRTRMRKIKDPYIRERVSDIDDLCNRLLRILVGHCSVAQTPLSENAIIVAKNLGPAELMEYGRGIKGIVLSQGSVGSHAAIVARSWAIPLIIQAKNSHYEAKEGDKILIDGEQGIIHLRPDETVSKAFLDKIEMSKKASAQFAKLRDKPAVTKDGIRIRLLMNAGLMADLPSLEPSGAEGVGLFRTELQFLVRQTVPMRSEMAGLYAKVMNSAAHKPVTFRTLDIGSDKVLPNMKAEDEPNPALGWRAIRIGLDRSSMLKMQIQCLLRAADGKKLRVMFPFITQRNEFDRAQEIFHQTLAQHISFGHAEPEEIALGAMLETPSIAYAPDAFYQNVDFISVGGNDLKMFFFAADRENERVRRRYDTLNTSYLAFLSHIINRCQLHNTPASFCGEDAGKPLEALAFAAMGFRVLSMRPASIGQVKHLIRQVDLGAVQQIIADAMDAGEQSVRARLTDYLAKEGIHYTRSLEN